jgi:subtilisin family serine protease
MATYRTQGTTTRTADPLFQIQPAASAWHLAALHRVATGRGVTIAVIDSKVDVDHPDLAGQFVADEDFVGNRSPPERHGTGIAGVIAAKAHNGIGISGIAPDARLMALRACWHSTGGATLCNSLSLARALQYAIEHGAGIVNLSLSGPPSALISKLIQLALARHTAIVAAFDSDLPRGGFPASLPGVIAVTDKSLQSWPARLYGAPGRDVPTTEPGGKWYLVNGSSYSAAHISGLIALARQERGRSASIDLARGANGWVDACATLLPTSSACDCSCALTQQIGARRP